MTILDFSEADAATLKTMIRNNTPVRNPTGGLSDALRYSPDVYIAFPKDVGGIPRSTSLGSGTAPDQPGSALCSIWKISNAATPAMEYAGFEKTVYNISEEDIERGWITIQRTKYGKWVVIQQHVDSSGGAGSVVEGTLLTGLTAATDALVVPSDAQLRVYGSVGTGTDTLAVGATITVVNRFTEIDTIPAGTWLVAVRVNAEWRPIAADCGLTGTG
jgi:hypothetical protein